MVFFFLSAFTCVEFTLEQSKGSLRESADYSFSKLLIVLNPDIAFLPESDLFQLPASCTEPEAHHYTLNDIGSGNPKPNADKSQPP